MKSNPPAIEFVLAKNLYALMSRHPELWSQSALAQRSGVNQRTIGRILSADTSAQLHTLQAIARAIGTTPAVLITPGAAGRPRVGRVQSRER
jgi:transcriptional regulator with XRE-family HTH domain